MTAFEELQSFSFLPFQRQVLVASTEQAPWAQGCPGPCHHTPLAAGVCSREPKRASRSALPQPRNPTRPDRGGKPLGPGLQAAAGRSVRTVCGAVRTEASAPSPTPERELDGWDEAAAEVEAPVAVRLSLLPLLGQLTPHLPRIPQGQNVKPVKSPFAQATLSLAYS